MKKILVVSACFAYGARNQLNTLLKSATGLELCNKLGISHIHSTYDATPEITNNLIKIYGDSAEFIFLPTTSLGVLNPEVVDPFVNKDYLTKLKNSDGSEAGYFLKNIPEDWKDFDLVYKLRSSSGAKGVFRTKPSENIEDYVVQRKYVGKEYLFDFVRGFNGNFIFTGRQNVKLINGRDKVVRFLSGSKVDDFELVAQVVEYVKYIDSVLGLPNVFNIQFIRTEEGEIKLLEIDSRFSGTLAVTDAYMKLLSAYLGFTLSNTHFFIDNDLNKSFQDSAWLVEVVK